MIRVITKPASSAEEQRAVAITPSPRAVFSLMAIFAACEIDTVGRDERPYGDPASHINW